MSFDQIEFKTQNSFEYSAELAIILPKFSTDFFQLDSFSEELKYSNEYLSQLSRF